MVATEIEKGPMLAERIAGGRADEFRARLKESDTIQRNR